MTDPHREAAAGRPGNGLIRLSVLLAAAALLMAFAGEPARLALRYERDAVLSGQVWRLVSAHLVHLGWLHLALNAAALMLVATLFGHQRRAMSWVGLALISALGVGLGLLAFSPQVLWYVGLSGLIHGLVAAGALTIVRTQRRAGLAWLALLAAKLAWEQWHGAVPGSEALIGGATIVDAHLYGSLAGLLGSLVLPATRVQHPASDLV